MEHKEFSNPLIQVIHGMKFVMILMDGLEQMSEGAGYFYNWKQVFKYEHRGLPKQFPALIVRPRNETLETRAYPLYHRKLEVEIEAIHKVPKTTRDDVQGAINKMLADIETAVMQDCTRGGAAVDCLIREAHGVDAVKNYIQVFVTLEINYRTLLKDPATGA